MDTLTLGLEDRIMDTLTLGLEDRIMDTLTLGLEDRIYLDPGAGGPDRCVITEPVNGERAVSPWKAGQLDPLAST